MRRIKLGAKLKFHLLHPQQSWYNIINFRQKGCQLIEPDLTLGKQNTCKSGY